jgi:hypothetical protein
MNIITNCLNRFFSKSINPVEQNNKIIPLSLFEFNKTLKTFYENIPLSFSNFIKKLISFSTNKLINFSLIINGYKYIFEMKKSSDDFTQFLFVDEKPTGFITTVIFVFRNNKLYYILFNNFYENDAIFFYRNTIFSVYSNDNLVFVNIINDKKENETIFTIKNDEEFKYSYEDFLVSWKMNQTEINTIENTVRKDNHYLILKKIFIMFQINQKIPYIFFEPYYHFYKKLKEYKNSETNLMKVIVDFL